MYLDNASLPSPSWMITGSMVRICQDVQLDRNLPPNSLNKFQLENRRRIFWACYIQERKLCLKKGRGVILHDCDIEVALPSALEGERGKSFTEGIANPLTGCGVGTKGKQILRECVGSHVGSTEHNCVSPQDSIQIFRVQIHISRLCEALIDLRLEENGGPRDLQRVKLFDVTLKKVWDQFPSHLIDLSGSRPLEIGALRRIYQLLYRNYKLA
jgi:hypothetical protein